MNPPRSPRVDGAVHRWFASLIAAASGLCAQAAPAPAPFREPFALLATDATGKPQANARVVLWATPLRRLPALDELPAGTALPPGLALAPATAFARATTGLQGVARVPAPLGALPQRAAGAALTEGGLGAVVDWLLPGRAQRLVLQPLAAVTLAADQEPFALHARAVLADGSRVPLPAPLDGDAAPALRTEHRLPAGDYELWTCSSAGWHWHRVALRSGERHRLSAAGPALQVHRSGQATLHPTGFPELENCLDAATIAVGGTALLGEWTGRWSDGWPIPAQRLPTGGGTPLPWPPTPAPEPDWLSLPGAFAAAPPPWLCVVAEGRRGWQLLACSPWSPAAGGGCQVPRAVPDDAWLLWLSADAVPLAVRWSERRDLAAALTREGRCGTLTALVRDPTGLPVGNLAAEYSPDGMAPATVLAHSDARGALDFGMVPLPGRLTVLDPRFRNQELVLAHAAEQPLALTVEPGAALRGRVHWPDGSPAVGVVVTLRDPRGQLRPAQRSMATDGEGAFAFAGLEAQQRYVLTASTPRGSRSFAAHLGAVLARDAGYVLTLRDEDPRLEASAIDR